MEFSRFDRVRVVGGDDDGKKGDVLGFVGDDDDVVVCLDENLAEPITVPASELRRLVTKGSRDKIDGVARAMAGEGQDAMWRIGAMQALGLAKEALVGVAAMKDPKSVPAIEHLLSQPVGEALAGLAAGLMLEAIPMGDDPRAQKVSRLGRELRVAAFATAGNHGLNEVVGKGKVRVLDQLAKVVDKLPAQGGKR